MHYVCTYIFRAYDLHDVDHACLWRIYMARLLLTFSGWDLYDTALLAQHLNGKNVGSKIVVVVICPIRGVLI